MKYDKNSLIAAFERLKRDTRLETRDHWHLQFELLAALQ